MPASRWRDWAARADEAFEDLAAGCGSVAVIGFSTGATLGLYLSSRKPVARQVLLAPFLQIRYTGMIPLPAASYLRPIASLWPDLPRRAPAVRDPEMRRWASGTGRFRTFNLHAALSALDLIDEVKPLVPLISTPTLIVQGRLDTVVDPAGAQWLYQYLGAREKSIISLQRTDHLIALDRERERAIQETLRFLRTAEGSTAISDGPPDLSRATQSDGHFARLL
jgi:carboxylesterase